MSSNEKVTMLDDFKTPPKEFSQVIAIIVAQHNGEGVNFSFSFNLDTENSKMLIRTLHEYLGKVIEADNEDKQKS